MAGGNATTAGVEVFVGDLATEAGDLARFLDGADILYHCAGEVRNEKNMRAVHVEGTRRLLRAATGRIGHWVQLSSVGVYGPQRRGVVTEDTPMRPQGEYERSKVESDQLVTFDATTRGFSHTVVRPTIVFGAGMPNNSLRQLVRAVRQGHFFFVGPPGSVVPYVHVDDVALAMHACGTLGKAWGRTFIVSENPTVENVVGTLCVFLDRKVPRTRIPEWLARMTARAGGVLPGFPLTASRIDALTTKARYDSTKIRTELQYVPRMDVEERLLQFLRDEGVDR